jgi:hypothetical protein
MVMKRLSAKLTGYASKECHEPLQSEKFLSDFGPSYFSQEHVAHKTGPTKEKPPPGSEGSFLMTRSTERRARRIEFNGIGLDSSNYSLRVKCRLWALDFRK